MAVGTNAWLGTEVERIKVKSEVRAVPAEATATARETASDDATLNETLLISGNEATGSCFTETTDVEFATDRANDTPVKKLLRDGIADSENSRGLANRGAMTTDDCLSDAAL